MLCFDHDRREQILNLLEGKEGDELYVSQHQII